MSLSEGVVGALSCRLGAPAGEGVDARGLGGGMMGG